MNKIQLTFLAVTLALINTSHAEEESLQSHESINAVVNDFLTQHIPVQGEYEITQTPLDDRLRLKQCPQPIEAFTTSEITHAGRVTVGVRCTVENKWSIFTSSFIKVYQSVVVVANPLQRGEIITAQHLAVERKDVSTLRQGFAAQPEQFENKQALRHIDVGTVLSSAYVVEPKLIKRGDKVTIISASPGFSIQMNGQAMMEGSKGQLIRIKNENSGRVISATILEKGKVAVIN